MPKTIPLILLAGLLAGNSAVASAKAEDRTPLPYGHPHFRPTAERPIGFMGDGTGYYPGARPPIEFRDGTPGEVEEPNPPHRPVRVQILTDNKAKNILWKTEMPSWANTQPVVVGDLVFTTGEPNLLIAVDAKTGAVRWTEEANAWEIAGVEQALAKRLQEMWHIANDGIPQFWAMTGRSTVSWEMPPERMAPILAVYRDKVQPRLLAALRELNPFGTYETAASNTLTGMDAYMAGDKGVTFRRNRDSFSSTVHRRIKALAGKNSVEMSVPWTHMVGLAINPPVSDGERIYASFGQGQTVCHDLTGRCLWATRVALNRDRVNPGNLLLSPLLAGDVLVDMHGGDTLRGLDKRNGRLLWEAPTQGDTPVKGGGYYVGNHRVMSLPGVDGVPVKIIVTTLCNIIRANDGKVLGTIPYEHKPSGGPTMLSLGDVVIKSSNGDGFSAPRVAYRLKFTSADHVACEELWEQGRSPGYHAQVGVDKWTIQGGSVYEVATGTMTYQNKGRSIGGYSQTLAGDRFIWTPDGSRRWGGRRSDGTVAHPFGVAVFNQGRLRFISNRNVLGESVPTRVPAMEKYAPELYALPNYEGASYGRPAHLLDTDCAVMPRGERLYIRTVTRLYCIGPAVKGTARDDPKVAAKIRGLTKAAALLPYLDKPSAMERYEATLALGKLGSGAAPAVAKLTLLASDDVYEEIRAAAVIALDAADPAGKPGTTALQAAVARSGQTDPTLAQALLLVGPERAGAAVIPLLSKERDQSVRLAAARTLGDAGVFGPKITAALLEALANDKSWQVRRLIGHNIASWPGDPAMASLLRDALAKHGGDVPDEHDKHPAVFWYVVNNLPPAERTAHLLSVAKSGSRHRGEAFSLILAIRPLPPGLGDWMIERAKAGDGLCIQQLAAAIGAEKAAPVLVEALANPAAVSDAAAHLLSLKKNELQAAAAMTKYLSSVLGDNGEMSRAMGAIDAFLGHSDAAVRQAVVPNLVAWLTNEKTYPDRKRFAAERLGGLKQVAAPALAALRQATSHPDKGLAAAAAAAIKAIEMPPTETSKK